MITPLLKQRTYFDEIRTGTDNVRLSNNPRHLNHAESHFSSVSKTFLRVKLLRSRPKSHASFFGLVSVVNEEARGDLGRRRLRSFFSHHVGEKHATTVKVSYNAYNTYVAGELWVVGKRGRPVGNKYKTY